MGDIVRLKTYRQKQSAVYFTRRELNQLLGVFGRGVVAQDWRDYTIDNRRGVALFCMYRSAFDRPLYKIFKLIGAGREQIHYVVVRNDVEVRRGTTLEQVLKVFNPPLRAVP